MSTSDTWATGAVYEPYMGRWSRLIATEFLGWLAVSPGAHWLDVGCGTGALAEAVLQQARPAAITGIDTSEAFLAHAREHVYDVRASFRVGDAADLPFPASAFDAVVSGLALNFIPDPARALAEMVRVVRPGGAVAVYVWDYGSGMQMLRVFWDAAVELDPSIAKEDEGRRFPICQREPLADLFESARLEHVKAGPIDVATPFRDFNDYWLPFLGGQGPAPGYVAALSGEKRAALRERIRSRLPIASDGGITLMARAWAARGTRR